MTFRTIGIKLPASDNPLFVKRILHIVADGSQGREGPPGVGRGGVDEDVDVEGGAGVFVLRDVAALFALFPTPCAMLRDGHGTEGTMERKVPGTS